MCTRGVDLRSYVRDRSLRKVAEVVIMVLLSLVILFPTNEKVSRPNAARIGGAMIMMMVIIMIMQPGDWMNYVGGNPWGHAVLLLTTPHAYAAPCLLGPPAQGERPEILELDVPVFTFKVMQSASNLFAMFLESLLLQYLDSSIQRYLDILLPHKQYVICWRKPFLEQIYNLPPG